MQVLCALLMQMKGVLNDSMTDLAHIKLVRSLEKKRKNLQYNLDSLKGYKQRRKETETEEHVKLLDLRL
jgi:hypothetical protein